MCKVVQGWIGLINDAFRREGRVWILKCSGTGMFCLAEHLIERGLEDCKELWGESTIKGRACQYHEEGIGVGYFSLRNENDGESSGMSQGKSWKFFDTNHKILEDLQKVSLSISNKLVIPETRKLPVTRL